MDEEHRIVGSCPYCSLPVFDPPIEVTQFNLIDTNDVAWHGFCAQRALTEGTRIRTKRFSQNMKKPKKCCIGYGSFEGKCKNKAGTPWTDLWCLRCDEIRRAVITASLEAICDRFDRPQGD